MEGRNIEDDESTISSQTSTVSEGKSTKTNASKKIKWITLSLERADDIKKQAMEICELYTLVHLQVKIDLEHKILKLTGNENKVAQQTKTNSLISGPQWDKVNKQSLVKSLRSAIKERITQFQYFFISHMDLDERALILENTKSHLRNTLKECPITVVQNLQSMVDQHKNDFEEHELQIDHVEKDTNIRNQEYNQEENILGSRVRQEEHRTIKTEIEPDGSVVRQTSSIMYTERESDQDSFTSDPSTIDEPTSPVSKMNVLPPRMRHPQYVAATQALYEEERKRKKPKKRKGRKVLNNFVHSNDLASTKVLNPLYKWEKPKSFGSHLDSLLSSIRQASEGEIHPNDVHFLLSPDELEDILQYRQNKLLETISPKRHHNFLRKGEGSLASTANPRPNHSPRPSPFLISSDPYREPPNRFQRDPDDKRVPFKTTFKPQKSFPSTSAKSQFLNAHSTFDDNPPPPRVHPPSSNSPFKAPHRPISTSDLDKLIPLSY